MINEENVSKLSEEKTQEGLYLISLQFIWAVCAHWRWAESIQGIFFLCLYKTLTECCVFRISCKCAWQGLPRCSRLRGLSAGASQGWDRVHLLQTGQEQAQGPCSFPACSCHRAELGSQLLHSSTLPIQAHSRFPASLGCKPDFLVYHQLPSFPQQKSAHVGKTPTTCVSVSPTLFQGHPLLQTNLSLSGVTDHFSAWLV